MISNDKNTSYSTDLCLLKKKLNVHGKYKFNYVHYVIDRNELRMKYWPSQITKPIKITISPLRLLKKFLKG
ncbi:hypothetical protein HYD68_03615 [Mycoplasmopsis bovis]|nr:hypothetical protein [Mycoplasmopsis bovis]QQH54718.1 hypothetical protein HYD68_03615 [Mycoplasmopsis bovis]